MATARERGVLIEDGEDHEGRVVGVGILRVNARAVQIINLFTPPEKFPIWEGSSAAITGVTETGLLILRFANGVMLGVDPEQDDYF